MAWPTKAQLEERKAMAETATQESDVSTFLSQIGTLEVEERPYRPQVIEGTEAVPEDIADAMESLTNTAVERRGKQKLYTIYDQFGIPSKVVSERLTMMLQDKHPRTGKHIFFSKPPKDAPKVVVVDAADFEQVDALIASKEAILVAGNCDGCGKPIAENPHVVRPMRITDREDAWWRVNQMKFPHMRKRHPMLVPRIYRNKDQRDSLMEAAIQAAK